MGYGNYSLEAHTALTAGRADFTRERIFRQTHCHPLMSPKGVRARESRDSAEHPSSMPIAFALDVTGSMGAIPEQIARQEMPEFMKILGYCGVADPQVMFLAVGDATCDGAALQVGQFETTAELMDQWLTWTFLEGGGGGSDQESYELALYFLAEHTDTDRWVKRKQRGYAFLTGDERPYPAVSKVQVEALIGDRLDGDIPIADVVAAVAETFHPFFLIPDHRRARRCEGAWRDLLGDHVIVMTAPEDTCYVAAGAIALTEGLIDDVHALAGVLTRAGTPSRRVDAIVQALNPYAATLGKDAAPALASTVIGWLAEGKSLWSRVSS